MNLLRVAHGWGATGLRAVNALDAEYASRREIVDVTVLRIAAADPNTAVLLDRRHIADDVHGVPRWIDGSDPDEVTTVVRLAKDPADFVERHSPILPTRSGIVEGSSGTAARTGFAAMVKTGTEGTMRSDSRTSFRGAGPGTSQRTGSVTTHWERAPVRTRRKRISSVCGWWAVGRGTARIRSRALALRRGPCTVMHADGMVCAGVGWQVEFAALA